VRLARDRDDLGNGSLADWPPDHRRQPVTEVRDAVVTPNDAPVFVTSSGVRDRGKHEDERAAIEAAGEVAEIYRTAVGDAGGGVQHPQFTAAAAEDPGAQRCVQFWPIDPRPRTVAVLHEGDQACRLQPRQPVPELLSRRTAASSA
jgi:hypothetical protein